MNAKLSLGLNIVLLVAVAFLFFKVYGTKEGADAVKTATDSVPQLKFDAPKTMAGAKVLYVNIDSIDQKYQAFQDLGQSVSGQLAYLQKTFGTKQQTLEARYTALQEKVKAGTISADEATKEEQEVNTMYNELAKLQQQADVLQGKMAQQNATITEEITKYFKVYSREKGIDYIIGYGTGSNLLYANDSLDVTQTVLDALNKNYAESKALPKPIK